MRSIIAMNATMPMMTNAWVEKSSTIGTRISRSIVTSPVSRTIRSPVRRWLWNVRERRCSRAKMATRRSETTFWPTDSARILSL